MNKSLINTCLDIVELDFEAEENQKLIEEKLKALGDKVDSYYHFNEFIKSQIELLKREREHITTQVNKYENLQERLKNSALSALNLLETDKIRSDFGHTIARRKSQEVKITSFTDLPEWAVHKEIKYSPNKTAIKDAIRAGKKVAGAMIQENEYAAISGPKKLLKGANNE